MSLNKKVAVILTFLAFIVGISLYCCNSPKDMGDKFRSWYKKQINETGYYTTSSGIKMLLCNLRKENTSINPKVILSILLDDESKYKLSQLSYDDRKIVIKECANFVIEYAKIDKWNNDYYLYVDCDVYDFQHIIYDYEKDEIWVPKCENIFIEMYKKFGTFHTSDLKKTQEGIDFLIDNKLAYIKHDEIEDKNKESYWVTIDNHGEFNSYDEEYSDKY